MKRLFNTKPLILLLFFSLGFSQEPEAIKAGMAPHSDRYAPGVDVVHYDVEIGIGNDADWIEGHVRIQIVLKFDAAVLPLDFTGLTINSIRVNNNQSEFAHENGVININLNEYKKRDSVF